MVAQQDAANSERCAGNLQCDREDHRSGRLDRVADDGCAKTQRVRRSRDTYPHAIELVAREQVDGRSLVTHRFPLEQTGEAFAVAHRREGIKVIVKG